MPVTCFWPEEMDEGFERKTEKRKEESARKSVFLLLFVKTCDMIGKILDRKVGVGSGDQCFPIPRENRLRLLRLIDRNAELNELAKLLSFLNSCRRTER